MRIAILFRVRPVLRARQSKGPVPAAPIPAQIVTGKKVFISNEGSEANVNLGDEGIYGEEPADSHNRFYAAVKDWVDMNSCPIHPIQVWFSRYASRPQWTGWGVKSARRTSIRGCVW
jgi:hypothetical protein